MDLEDLILEAIAKKLASDEKKFVRKLLAEKLGREITQADMGKVSRVFSEELGGKKKHSYHLFYGETLIGYLEMNYSVFGVDSGKGMHGVEVSNEITFKSSS